MNDNLTQAEAEKLFAQVSKSISADDPVKLSELMTPSAVEPQEVEEKEENQVEEQGESSSDANTTQVNQEEVQEESGSPSEETQAEPVEEEQVEEPSELTKLKEQLDKLKKENHSLKSQAGRVPSVQRQVAELTKKLEELTNASTPSNLPSAKLAPKLKEKLNKISETDPELAQAIIDSVAAASDEVAFDNLARNQDTIALLRDLHIEEQKQQQMNLLLEEYPNAIDIFKSDAWKSWKNEQSEAVQRLAGSGFARDVALAFELYAKDMIAKHPELAPKAETPASTNAQATKIEEARQHRKATSVNVATKAAPAQVKLPDDPELLFKQAYADIQKQLKGQ